MFRPTRALVVALALAGTVMLANPAAGIAAPRHPACVLTFTRAMFSRPAILFYRGTRTPNARERADLWRFLRCARGPGIRAMDHRVWSRERAANAARKEAALAVPESSLAVCIISRESGGNPQAVNGQYEGIAQWSPTSWIGGGGGRFASTPLGATYSEQVQILNSMLPAQAGQWEPYDGC